MLRALILEDSPKDVEIIRELLIDAGFDLNMDCTAIEKEFVSFLSSRAYDVILADFKLPGFDGFGALRWAKEICPNVPFICVSGAIGEETAVELLKLGAVDYVLKDRPKRLPFAIKRALDEAKEKERQRAAEEELRKSELRFKQVSESAHEWVWEVDRNGLYTYVNPIIKELLGYEAGELIGIKYFYDFFDPENKEEMKQATLGAFARKESFRNFVNCNIHKDGRKIILSTTGFPILDTEKNLIGYRGADVDITERIRAEEALREERDFSRNLTETAQTIILLLDTNGKIVHFNPYMEEISGYKLEEVVSKDWFTSFLPENIQEKVKALFLKATSGINTRGYINPIITKDKKQRFIEWYDKSLKDTEGNIIGLLAIGQDITERKRAEQKLSESEKRYRLLFELSSDGILIADVETKAFKYANPALCRMLGYTEEELLTLGIEDIHPKQYLQRVNAEFDTLNRSDKTLALDIPCLRKDGRILYVDISSTNVTIDGRTYNAGFFRDITERKRAEESMRESEERYRSVAQSANDAIITTDSKGIILGWNKGAEKIFGFTESELTGKEVAVIIPKSYREQHINGMRRIEQGGEHHVIGKTVELHGLHKNGKEFPLELSLAKWETSKGKFFTGIIRDITERKRAEEEIVMLAHSLRSIDESVSVTDMEDKILFVNESLLKTYGYDENELNGKQISILRSLNNPPELVGEIMPSTICGGWKGELWNKRKDGSEFPIYLSTTVINDKDGKTLGLIGVAQDITERKRSEKALRESEDKFRSLVENISDVFYVSDQQGKFLYCSPNFFTISGYSPQDIYGNSFIRVVAPIDRRQVVDYYLEQTAKGSLDLMTEFRFIQKDGSIIWVEQNTRIVRDSNGKMVQFRNVARNITERKRSEKALRESEERLRIIAENTNAALYRLKYSDEMKYDYINPAIEKLTGYNPDEINKIGFASLVVKIEGTGGKELKDEELKANRDKLVYEFSADYLIKTKHGNFKWLSDSSYPWFDENGTLIGSLGILTDITQRKEMENELRHSEEKFSQLFNLSPDVLNLCTWPDGKYIAVNNMFTKLSGYTFEEVLDKSSLDLDLWVHPEQRAVFGGMLATENGSATIETQLKMKDGHIIDAIMSGKIIEMYNVPYLLIVTRDMTVRKQIESELIESKEKAESANKLKDAFINNMSHEIRTPLNGILGLTSLVKEYYARYVEKDDESLFTGIDHSAQRIIRTVDMILNYSRLQTGEFAVISKEINLLEICKHIINQNKESAAVKNLELRSDNRCDDAKITGDEYTITQIVSNLVENAIKYTKKGTIEVALTSGTDGGVTLEIKDTGIGIASEYLEHLFEPYRQEEMGYGRTYEGLGLGLALTKKYCELNSAELTVTSKKGEGTTFSIKFNKERIPQISEINLTKKVKPVIPTVSKKETVILVVENDLLNQNLIKRILRKKYELFFAVSAEEAYEVLKKNEIDLILMDISIEGTKNGLELTKELKGTKKYSHIPVIAVTAHAGNEDQRNALTAGCDEYLAKPFSIDQLFKKIGKFV